MTVHPLRPSDRANSDRSNDEPFSDEPFRDGAGSASDRRPHLGRRLDELDPSLNRYGSFDGDDHVAHRAVTPTMLSGLCWLEADLCRAFHAAMFELLEDIGDFDGMIATRDFFVDRGSHRLRAANHWLFDHPAPSTDDDSRAARDAIAEHSLALAIALDTNPSLTFASSAALRERLLEAVLEIVGPDVTVSEEQIGWLADLTLRLLAELDGYVETLGGYRVWAAEDPPASSFEPASE